MPDVSGLSSVIIDIFVTTYELANRNVFFGFSFIDVLFFGLGMTILGIIVFQLAQTSE